MTPALRLRYVSFLLLLIMLAPVLTFAFTLAAPTNGPAAVRYTDAGALLIPAYREWVFMSSGIDMSYTDKPSMQGESMFDNVFVDPDSWAVFKQTGHWPDKTVFALENRGARSKGSINKLGHFQTEDLMGLEFHVRDESRFSGGWGFFVANEDGTTATLLPSSAPCYACHLAHGAADTTFTQFYPTARPIAEKAGNFHPN